jgi:membrane protease YdiL (CAAX protease family)
MFDKSQSRIVIILGFLGIFCCIFSLAFISGISGTGFKFPLEKDKIIDKADKFLRLNRILPKPFFIRKARVSSNQESIIFLEKALGVDKANKLLESLPLYYWNVDYVFSLNKKNFLPLIKTKRFTRVVISPITGKIIGFNRLKQLDAQKHPRALSKNETEVIANDFFNSIDFKISDFRMTRYSSLGNDYIFEWEKDVPELAIAKLKVKLDLYGDRINNFHFFLKIPKNEFARLQLDSAINSFISFILRILVFMLGAWVLITTIIKRKELEWGFGLPFALLMLVSLLWNFLRITDYRGFYLAIFLYSSILICIIYFLWTMMMSSVAKLFAKETSFNMFPVKISSSIFVSYIFFFSGIGFTMLFFIFVIKIFNPVTTLGFDSFFSELASSRWSCLIAPLLSLQAGVFEELFFRALMISFFKKYLKSTILAIIISSLVWSFLHVAPIGDSDIYPSIIKGIILLPIGILFGYIFIRFGLVCAIITHYLHDLVVIGAAFLEFNNFRYVNENIVTLLISAVLPLLIAFYFKAKESNV